MVEGPTDEGSLKGLADAIKLLYDTEAREWTAGDIISLLDELSGVAFPSSLVPRVTGSGPRRRQYVRWFGHGAAWGSCW